MKNILKKFLLPGIFSILFTIFFIFNVLSGIQSRMEDFFYQKEDMVEGNIFVIGIDSKSLEELGPFHTWSRSYMAKAIENLNKNSEEKPLAIGIDIMYYGYTNEDDDKYLADVCSKYDNIVMASSAIFQNEFEKTNNGYILNKYHIYDFEEPYKELKEATIQGHINTMSDSDGIVRHSIYNIKVPDGRVIQSFASQIANIYAKSMGIELKQPPLNENSLWYIPFIGKPGAYYDYFSFSDLLNGELTGDMFADSIVLIGPYATGLQDSFITSIDHTKQMYGVEIHANVTDALLRGNFKNYANKKIQIIISVFIIFIATFLFEKLKVRYSLPLLVTLTLGYIIFAKLLFTFGIIINILYIPLFSFLAYIGATIKNYIVASLEKIKITNTFKRYLEPKVVDKLIKSGTDSISLGGTITDISCLFVDIRGFTPMSEILNPEQVVEILNEYFELVTKCIFKYDGTLDKFIGDAAMAIFNAPVPINDYIYKSICAAWDIAQGSNELANKLEKKFGRSISFGIGINCGEAIVGNIGTETRMDYTAIGNTVNTASRLEANAGKGQIFISQNVYNAVKDRIKATSIGNIPLKGKNEELEVFVIDKLL